MIRFSNSFIISFITPICRSQAFFHPGIVLRLMRKHARSLLLALFICSCAPLHAQYTLSGKIEYERKVNVYAQMNEFGDNDWFEGIKSQLPKFSSTYFDLVFDTSRSLYKPGKEVEQSAALKMMGNNPANDNIVYTEFAAKKVTATKIIFDQKFLVQDSMRKIDWVEKDDIRTIMGFKCHKAVGRICDSVYVVAFYTEDISACGGPEMFGGLPGMIMELAIPRLHTTWTADKFEVSAPGATEFKVSEKGKKVTELTLYETLSDRLKDWGKYATRNIWWIVL